MDRKNQRTRRITHEEVAEEFVTDFNTGEVASKKTTTQRDTVIAVEPNYVKLYLDCLATYYSVPVSSSPILLALLSIATYANKENGLIIFLNKMLKENIAKQCNVSLTRVEHAITDFVKHKYIYRLGTGTYQLNAELFGKGEWKNISNIQNIQAKYTFGKNGTVIMVSEDDNNTTDRGNKNKETPPNKKTASDNAT
ncbi:MAG: hypothetical protein IKH75_12510 [Ruminococcus sp.]|nr:hypothetical protein [Ruminococcus sp.]